MFVVIIRPPHDPIVTSTDLLYKHFLVSRRIVRRISAATELHVLPWIQGFKE